jgi:hypothetical protein
MCGWALASPCAKFGVSITYAMTIPHLCVNGICSGNGGAFSTLYSIPNAFHYLDYAYAAYCPMNSLSNWFLSFTNYVIM